MKKKSPYYDEGMWKGAPPEGFKKAQALRAKMTQAEVQLWEELNKAPFRKFKFRRQHPIQNFIADFYSHQLKLIIEVDGEYHEKENQKKRDIERTETLKAQGLDVLRFKNEEVLQNISEVLMQILSWIDSLQK